MLPIEAILMQIYHTMTLFVLIYDNEIKATMKIHDDVTSLLLHSLLTLHRWMEERKGLSASLHEEVTHNKSVKLT